MPEPRAPAPGVEGALPSPKRMPWSLLRAQTPGVPAGVRLAGSCCAHVRSELWAVQARCPWRPSEAPSVLGPSSEHKLLEKQEARQSHAGGAEAGDTGAGQAREEERLLPVPRVVTLEPCKKPARCPDRSLDTRCFPSGSLTGLGGSWGHLLLRGPREHAPCGT